jgi:hypothetical protein
MISKLATLKPFTKSSSFSSLLSSSAFARSDLQPTQRVKLDHVYLLACSELDIEMAKNKHK